MGKHILALACLCAAVGASFDAAAQPNHIVWPRLERFSSEADFNAYLADLSAEQRRAAQDSLKRLKQEEVCPPEEYPCGDEDEEQVVVTGSRLAAPRTITNVQSAGVDEGDIVKLFGRFLIVLQDGRLFSIDTGNNPAELRLVDRANVYRRPDADAWYDEILLHENRIVVTGYNYEENATEFTVFSIGRSGHLTREGAYFLSSNDYYDTENYATRLVDGNLIVYTPLDVGNRAYESNRRPQWPLVRRWLRETERAVTTRGRRLYAARDIYRPLQYTLEPTIHTFSVCPLGSPRAGDELECRTTALVGPGPSAFFVSTDHIYLWTWPGEEEWLSRAQATDCARRKDDPFLSAVPSLLTQIPLEGAGGPRARFVRGAPWDQLSMDATNTHFRALAVWVDPQCQQDDADLPLRYLQLPLQDFSAAPAAAPESAFTPLPSAGGAAMENRFTSNFLVYGGRSEWRSYPPADGEPAQSARVVVVPTASPGAPHVLATGHSALRVERVGDNAIVSGYRDSRGLTISLIDLSGAPRIASSVLIEGRYESEGRSHAFNSAVDAGGAGAMGVPTVLRQSRSGRWWWNSRSSDVSFVAIDFVGGLHSLGALLGAEHAEHAAYECEVSCVDWYGNSRPIFVGDRIFALAGVELIEGRVDAGAIRETARVNLTAPR